MDLVGLHVWAIFGTEQQTKTSKTTFENLPNAAINKH